MNSMKGPFHSMDPATKEFTKKFKDKTKNDWSNRDSFTPHTGKYTLIEMGGDDDDDEPMVSGQRVGCHDDDCCWVIGCS